MSGEQYTNFRIEVTMPDGQTEIVPQLARSKWEAKDKVYNKYSDKQPLRNMYKPINSIINLNKRK